MSKKSKLLKGKPVLGIGDMDPVKLITSHVSKKGRLKGDKKERRNLKAVCPHHMYTRKGKLKPTIETDGKGNCRCYICGDIIPMHLANEQEIQKETNRFAKYVTQGLFLAESLGAGKKTIEQCTDTKILVRKFPKVYSRLSNVAKKQDRVKKNKKNKNNRNFGSGSFGGWGSKR